MQPIYIQRFSNVATFIIILLALPIFLLIKNYNIFSSSWGTSISIPGTSTIILGSSIFPIIPPLFLVRFSPIYSLVLFQFISLIIFQKLSYFLAFIKVNCTHFFKFIAHIYAPLGAPFFIFSCTLLYLL